MKKILRLVIAMILIFNLSGCGEEEEKIPDGQYNDVGKTILTCFKNKDKETLISLFSENMQSSHDLEMDIEKAFDFIEGEIIVYSDSESRSSITSNITKEEKNEEGVCTLREGEGKLYFHADSGEKYSEYRITFKVRDIDTENEKNVGVTNVQITTWTYYEAGAQSYR